MQLLTIIIEVLRCKTQRVKCVKQKKVYLAP